MKENKQPIIDLGDVQVVFRFKTPLGCTLNLNLECRSDGGKGEKNRLWSCLSSSTPTPWGTRLSCEADAATLLPLKAEMAGGGEGWRWRLLFDQAGGLVRYFKKSRVTAAVSVNKLKLGSPCLEPVSSLEMLRRRIGPARPELSLSGTVGAGHFVLDARLKGREAIEVPAGRFEAYRLDCEVRTSNPAGGGGSNGSHPFNLWLTGDDRRLPLRAEGKTALGPFSLSATEIGPAGR